MVAWERYGEQNTVPLLLQRSKIIRINLHERGKTQGLCSGQSWRHPYICVAKKSSTDIVRINARREEMKKIR
jgi:hypothetical protein